MNIDDLNVNETIIKLKKNSMFAIIFLKGKLNEGTEIIKDLSAYKKSFTQINTGNC